MLRFIIALILLFWLLGFIFDVIGGLIHILLVIAVIVIIVRVVFNKKKP